MIHKYIKTKKEVTNLKFLKESKREDLEGGMRRAKWYNYNLKSYFTKGNKVFFNLQLGQYE